jgi:hypothetical protein
MRYAQLTGRSPAGPGPDGAGPQREGGRSDMFLILKGLSDLFEN